jgi:hypothetical protein
MQYPKAKAKSSWQTEPWLWLVIMIPAAAVLMGIAMVIVSVVSYDGLVVDDYYKRGLAINRSLARDQTAAAYGLNATLDVDQSREAVAATLTWEPGFTPPHTVHLGLYHATRSGFDAELSLQRTANNRYKGHLPSSLSPGKYYLQLEAHDWRLRGTLHQPGQHHGVALSSPTPS